jgi:hypothetical protein
MFSRKSRITTRTTTTMIVSVVDTYGSLGRGR